MSVTYWDDIDVGMEREGGAFRFSEKDIIRFAREFDPRPAHTDPDAARDTLFKGLSASGIHTLGAWARLWWELTPDFADQAGAEMKSLRLLRPVRPGDELRLLFRVTDKRMHPFNGGFGFIGTDQRLISADGHAVLRVACQIMLARRPG